MDIPAGKNFAPRPAIYIGDVAREALSLPSSSLKDGKYTLEPLKSLTKNTGVPVNILVDKNVPRGVNEAEIHRHEADLWIGIDGEVHFQVGGVLVEPYAKKNADGSQNDLELKAKEISGGQEYTLSEGDILYIPEGQPHVHWTDENQTARLWIIKIPAGKTFPLEKVSSWRA